MLVPVAGIAGLNYVPDMAELWNPHGGSPVNEGERRAVQALVDGLPDDYKVIPSLEVRYDDRTDEIDAIVSALSSGHLQGDECHGFSTTSIRRSVRRFESR